MENKPEETPKSGPGIWRGGKGTQNMTGRPKGSKNKNTQQIREAYQRLTEDNLENMSIWIQQIAADSPEKAFKLMLEMSEFVLPKISRMELTSKDGEDLFKNMKFEFGPSIGERLDSLDGIETIEPLDD
jgi:hypothetical protein|tara:strand:+ start:172 stop:558 length:387 start_codon:yes stop_codon:yes gene_type:complete